MTIDARRNWHDFEPTKLLYTILFSLNIINLYILIKISLNIMDSVIRELKMIVISFINL